MGLTSEDVEVIGRLLDERLAAHKQSLAAIELANQTRLQDDRRRTDQRRNLWRALFIVLLVALGIGCWFVVKVYNSIHAQVTAGEAALQNLQQQLSDTKIAYQAELKQNKEWQKERAEAVATTHYDSTQNQAGFDANLVAKTFALLNKAQQAKAKAKTSTGDDEADLDAQLQGMSDVSDGVTNILMQLMLHETDPAHDSPGESAAINDSHQRSPTPAEQATPLQAAPAQNPTQNAGQNPTVQVTQAPSPPAQNPAKPTAPPASVSPANQATPLTP